MRTFPLASWRGAGTLHVPLDFISWVQTWMSSCISSGATSLRDHASSHRGFGCATGWSPLSAYLAALEAERGPSLDLKTFLKKGMADRGSLGASQSAGRHPLPVRWKGGEAVELVSGGVCGGG